MKRVGKPMFFIVAILILVFSYLAFFGLYGMNGDIKNTYVKGVSDIRWGIDINGGVEATFTPDTKGEKATPEQVQSAKSIIETRLAANHITDNELYVDEESARIIVRFPWKNGDEAFDPEEAIQELSATAELTFREGMEAEQTETGPEGEIIYKVPSGTTKDNIILEGKDVKSAKAEMVQDPQTNVISYQVSLELNDSGTEKFAEATGRLQGQIISIWMDDTMISYPTVQAVITDGKASITGGFDATEAEKLASQINGGALPFKLTTTNFSTISPTLGASALQAMLVAGIIGFTLVCIFMVIVYRLPGFVAVIALIGQVALSFAAVSGFFPFVSSFTMTLPGIAGIILSIGMGVDANIITATRIKEELWSGKTLDGSIQKGDESSFWAIFDGNITTIIVSVVLMVVFGPTNILSKIFGPSVTGAIYSFGYTLLVGNFGNFIMGVGATRLMIKSIAGYKAFRNKWLYGGAANEKI